MFVFENTPTREQERRADELCLPRCFFLYESAASPCAGCIGCEPDDFDFATIGRASGKQRPPICSASVLIIELQNDVTGGSDRRFSVGNGDV